MKTFVIDAYSKMINFLMTKDTQSMLNKKTCAFCDNIWEKAHCDLLHIWK